MKIFIFLLFIPSFLFADLPKEPTDEEALAKLTKVLSKQVPPYSERHIQRVGNKTILFEAYIAVEADAKLTATILSDFKNIPNWALININNKPGGGTYYVKVQEIKPDPKDSSLLNGFFKIDVPVFKSVLHGVFKLSSEEKASVFNFRGKMIPDTNSVLDSADAVLKSFPTPKKSPFRWIYVYSTVVLRNWLLYEAFPERLLKRESGERIQIVLDNYQNEEERLKKN